MKLLLFLLFTSASLFGQVNNDIQNQIKLKSYSHLDSINGYSPDYSTNLIEGSGSIIRNDKNIGSTGFSIEITKDKNDKTIRVLKSESIHYKKYDQNPQKSVINKITIYFNEFQQPAMAKTTAKTLISNSLVTTRTRIFDLSKDNTVPEFIDVGKLLEIIKKYK